MTRRTRTEAGSRLAAQIGAELREQRHRADLSLEAAAAVVDKGRDWLSKVETGKIAISVVNYLRLTEFLTPEGDHPAHRLREHHGLT